MHFIFLVGIVIKRTPKQFVIKSDSDIVKMINLKGSTNIIHCESVSFVIPIEKEEF